MNCYALYRWGHRGESCKGCSYKHNVARHAIMTCNNLIFIRYILRGQIFVKIVEELRRNTNIAMLLADVQYETQASYCTTRLKFAERN
jgi:hypothetical protein